jgi:hypothetical protein
MTATTKLFHRAFSVKKVIAHIGAMSTMRLALRARGTKASGDEVWIWNSLSKIVQQINQSGTWSAELTTQDMPAVFLCKQTNAAVGIPCECVVSEVGLLGLLDLHSPPSLRLLAARLPTRCVSTCKPSSSCGAAMVIAKR